MKTKQEIVLKALLNGTEIHGDHGMIYCISEDNKFGIKMTNEDGEECVMITDFSLNWFIKFCDSLTPEQITNIVLNSINLNESNNND